MRAGVNGLPRRSAVRLGFKEERSMSHPWIITVGRRGPALGLALLGLLGVVVLTGADQPPAAPPAGPPAASQTPMPADQLIADARGSFSRVRDYMGTLVKQERVGGQMQPEQFINLRVRQQPFSVHLKWQGPK